MHPYLFDLHLFGYQLRPPSYGIFLSLAFSAAYLHSLWCAKKEQLDFRHVENFFLIIIGCSIVGARLFHVLFEEPRYYLAHPEKIFVIWEGGYTLYGALLLSIVGLLAYGWGKKLPTFRYADLAAMGTALGIFIGRVGCFLAGCCWGTRTECFLGVTYTHPQTFAGVKGLPVHPSQLYEATGALLVFFFLRYRYRSRRYPGQLFYEGMFSYAVLRFIVEYFRGDGYRGYLIHPWISYSQAVSLLLIPIALYGIKNATKSKG